MNEVNIIKNMFEDFIEDTSLTDKQKEKAKLVKILLENLNETNGLHIYKIHLNKENKVEFVGCATEWYIDIEVHEIYEILCEMCEIDIDTNSPKDVEMIIKFIVKPS